MIEKIGITLCCVGVLIIAAVILFLLFTIHYMLGWVGVAFVLFIVGRCLADSDITW